MINLADAFERVVDRIAGREAVVCGARRLTYAQLDDRANRLAHWFAARGVGPGDDVAVYARNGTEYLEAMLAAFKIRAIPINVNYRYRAEELRYLLTDSRTVAAVVAPEFQTTLAEVAPDLPVLVTGPDYEVALSRHRADRDFAPRLPDDQYVLYTGGTTGLPKGVVWRHDDIFFAALAGPHLSAVVDSEGVAGVATGGGHGRLLVLSPLMHGAAHWGALATFYSGNVLVLDDHPVFDPERVLRLVERERITAIGLVGDAFARPLTDALAGFTGDVSSLGVVLSGGAVLSPAVKQQLAQLRPGIRIVDGYGSSETGVQGQAAADLDAGAAPRFTIGPETCVVDENLKPVAPGSGRVGKLARRGRTPLAYRNDPERTARTFPVINGVRWAITGDDATVAADGSVVLLGRGSTCINTGGEKVYPDEVEGALKEHPSVYDAIVVGAPHPRFGEQVAAVVQHRPGAAPAVADIQGHVGTRLAGYKVPRLVLFVPQLVRSPAGKPDIAWARGVVANRLAANGADAD